MLRGKKGKNTKFRALKKSLHTPYGSHRSQKQLKYMPAHNRYLGETFECIRYMRDLIKDLKQPKWLKTLNLGPF